MVTNILEYAAVREMALPITVAQYHSMGEAGIISERTELIRGVIIEKMTKTPEHSWIVRQLFDWLSLQLPSGYHARKEEPLSLSDSEPEADIAVVSGQISDYRSAHPTTAKLVIEVAVSSLDIERAKKEVYAEAGVEEYLIVCVPEKSVEIYRGSNLDDQSAVAASENLRFSSFSGLMFNLADLFSASDSGHGPK